MKPTVPRVASLKLRLWKSRLAFIATLVLISACASWVEISEWRHNHYFAHLCEIWRTAAHSTSGGAREGLPEEDFAILSVPSDRF
jgi:hypothetical protein